MINLISDTVTKPTPLMLQHMMTAEVGDDVFGADPTINKLESYVADMFGMEAALYCPSGTMTNQIAIKCHTRPLDEVICDHYSHVYQYETGGYAFNSGVAIISKLVVLENSCNKGGGSYYTLDEIAPITKLCKEKGLTLHLDGARLFNVLVETGERTQDVGKHFDSISICISKGLGAPVGSLLIGTKKMVTQARRYRKVMGGGMRQAGYLAAACLYALQNQRERLKEDNDRAKELGSLLAKQGYVSNVRPVKTNIVIFDLREMTADEYLEKIKDKGILASAFGPKTVRFVTHLDYSSQMHDQVMQVITEI